MRMFEVDGRAAQDARPELVGLYGYQISSSERNTNWTLLIYTPWGKSTLDCNEASVIKYLISSFGQSI